MYSLFKGRKGMEISNLYGFVLMLVLVGLVIGVGMITIDKLRENAMTGSLNATRFGGVGGVVERINQSNTALASVSNTWLTLIVTISVLAIILLLVIRSFQGR